MQQRNSASSSAGCYHIVRWADSGIFCTIALRRCYRSRSAASTARYRGLTGDRAREGDHLARHGAGNRLAVVRCNPGCPCQKWRTGVQRGESARQTRKAATGVRGVWQDTAQGHRGDGSEGRGAEGVLSVLRERPGAAGHVQGASAGPPVATRR